MSLGAPSSSYLKYWVNLFLFSALGAFPWERKENFCSRPGFPSYCPPAFPLLLKSLFPYKPGASFFQSRGLVTQGCVCGHIHPCLRQQKVLGVNKILCRGHTTSSRSQTLIFFHMGHDLSPASPQQSDWWESQESTGCPQGTFNVSAFSLAEYQDPPSKDKWLFTLVPFEFIYLSIFLLVLDSC